MIKNKKFRGSSNHTDHSLAHIVFPELSKYLVERDVVNRKTAMATAQKLSTLDYGSLHESAKIPDFIGGIVSEHQEDIDAIESKLSGGLQKVKGQSKISDSEEATALLDAKIGKIDDKITPIKGKLDSSIEEHAPAVNFFNRVIMPITIFIACIELVANFEIFSLLGGGLFSNIAIASLVAISVYWYGHFAPDKVKKYGNGNVVKEVSLFFAFIIPLSILFFMLSSMRINYLLALNPEMSDVFTTNPYVFTLANVLAYIIIYWLVNAYKSSQSIRNAYKKHKRDCREIRKLEEQKIKLLEERSLIAPELRERLTDHYNILLIGKQKELEVDDRLRSNFERFKSELYLKTNGACAPLFTGDIDKDLPKLRFNFQDVEPKLQSS